MPDKLRQAADHLAKNDPVLAPVIKRSGPIGIRPHSDYYGALVDSIIGQQISVSAAVAVKRRFRGLYGGRTPAPRQILETAADDLRAIGFSYRKAAYAHDLARHVIDGRLNFGHLDQMANQEIINMLVDAKGIGEWTAHMFLIFCVGRPDVLAVGDLGVRNGIRALYGFRDAPTPDQIRGIADKYNWHPYESAACWYVWRSLDFKADLDAAIYGEQG